MQVVEARASVRDRLRAAGLDEKLGGINRFRTVAQVVEDFDTRRNNDHPQITQITQIHF
jgi:hypothetical protein